jgi:hypothetical protein
MKQISYDDITGSGVAAQLITLLKIGGVAVSQKNWDTKYWQAVMISLSGTARIGDANVSATNGIPVTAAGGGQFTPPIAFATDKYELSDVWVLIPSGAVMSVARWV